MCEDKIFELWTKVFPTSAFPKGIESMAGRVFVPTDERLEAVLHEIDELKKEAEYVPSQKVLDCMERTLTFREPYQHCSGAIWTIFGYLSKEGIVAEHMLPLLDGLSECIKLDSERFSAEWPIEVKITTFNAARGLVGIANVVKEMAKDEQIKAQAEHLISLAKGYAEKFRVKGIENGGFDEVFPVLEEESTGDVGRREVYPHLLVDLFDYPESAQEIEEKALSWIDSELPEMQKLTAELAPLLDTEEDIEAVDKAISAKRNVPLSQLLNLVKEMRSILQPLIEKHVVRVSPAYDTRVIETPSYLLNFISTAAMTTFNTLAGKQFNIFFVTTSERFSPSTAPPRMFSTLVHEEYGHCFNFTNSALGFAYKPKKIELLELDLNRPITEGISFHREFEAINLFERLYSEDAKDARPFFDFISRFEKPEHFLMEARFEVLLWRIIRFLRAVGDTRINTNKQSFAEFINWANRRTHVSKKLIFDQLFLFMEYPGYAPSYSIAGQSLRRLQEKAVQKGKDIIEFNTLASSMGFPSRTVFEERLREWIEA